MSEFDWLKKLKTGDEVVVKAKNYADCAYYDDVVEKITSTGLIKVNGDYYDHKGREMTSELWSGYRTLVNPKDENAKKDIEKYKEEQFVKQVVGKMKNIPLNCVSFEQAVEIAKIFG